MSQTFDVYGVGICYAAVCAPATASREVIEHAVNEEHPTGIPFPWRISEDTHFATGEPNPHPCEADGSRLHWLLSC